MQSERESEEYMRWFREAQKSLQRKIKERYSCIYVCACGEVAWGLDEVDVWGAMELQLGMAGARTRVDEC